MISGVLVCDNKKCGETMFEEVFISQVVPPGDIHPAAQSGKVNLVTSTGRFAYRCIKCGKLYKFQPEDPYL